MTNRFHIQIRACAVDDGSTDHWRDFVLFGESKIDLLKEYYPFSNGIACKDTFARIFAVLDPEAFKSCFVSWIKSLQSALQEVIAIDGKTLCNSADLYNNRGIGVINCDTKSLNKLLQQAATCKQPTVPSVVSYLDMRLE